MVKDGNAYALGDMADGRHAWKSVMSRMTRIFMNLVTRFLSKLVVDVALPQNFQIFANPLSLKFVRFISAMADFRS
jgi:hypothetical protein